MYPIVYYVVRYRRHVVRKNLENSFPEKSLKEIRGIERRFYRFFCDYFVETMKALTISKKNLMRRMSFTGVDKMEETLQHKQFVFIYLGHFCNWEYIASLQWWVKPGIHCSQLYSRLHSKVMDRLFYAIRSRYGGENINKKESLRRIVHMQKEGSKNIIGFISDQAPKRENTHLWIPFLNQDTAVFTGTERIAKKVDAAVFYGEVSRKKRGYYHCDFLKMTDEPRRYGEHELTRHYMQMLEEDIRRDPARWLWTHNRWKRKRPADVDEYNNKIPSDGKNASMGGNPARSDNNFASSGNNPTRSDNNFAPSVNNPASSGYNSGSLSSNPARLDKNPASSDGKEGKEVMS